MGLQTIPTRCSASLLCASPSPQTDNLSQCRLNPFDLICHFELSDHASVTCLSICLGIPVLHARILRTQPAYSTIDQWADFLLNDSARASRSQHASHDKPAYTLANLASLQAPALEFTLPPPRVLFCEPRLILFVVETLSLLLVVSDPVQLIINFHFRLCLSLMSSSPTPLTDIIP